MSDYIKYRFCPNKTCDNHINKKKFKNGATVCGECGFELKDYDFDPVTRTILNYDDDTETQTPTQETTEPETNKSEDVIDFSSVPEASAPLFTDNSTSKPNVSFDGGAVVNNVSYNEIKENHASEEKPSEKVVQNEQPISTPTPTNAPNQEKAVIDENEELKRQLAEMQKQMAMLQGQILNNNKEEAKPEAKPTDEVKGDSTEKAEEQKAEFVAKPEEEKHISMPVMTDEEKEAMRKKVRETVNEEFQKAKIEDEKELERERFEKEYNQKKKEKKELIEEERELQKRALMEGKDPSEIELSKADKNYNSNADGYYNSNEPEYEEAVKRSIKATVKKVLILAGIIVLLLYGILYFTQ